MPLFDGLALGRVSSSYDASADKAGTREYQLEFIECLDRGEPLALDLDACAAHGAHLIGVEDADARHHKK